MSKKGTIRVGIGGWVFPPWRGTFYPPKLPQAQELNYASRHLTAIEINGTFYGAQKPSSYQKWHAETPDDFMFSLKGSRFVTHRSELASAEASIENFFSRGVMELGEKRGPILWQMAPTKQFKRDDTAAFLALLPKTIGNHKIRHVIEARHQSFAEPAFFELAREHNVAVAMVDDAKYPAFNDVTSDFVYLRLRRCSEDERTGYPPISLDEWAGRARAWAAEGRDVFLYFINGAKVRAPHAAMALIGRF